MRVHPLLWPALAMAAGSLAAFWLEPPAWPLLTTAAVGLAVLLWLGGRGRGLPLILVSLTCLCFAAGHLALNQQAGVPADDISRFADNVKHLIVADVINPAEPRSGRWRMLARAVSVDGRAASGGVWVSFAESIEPPAVGWRFSFSGRLRPIRSMANPGGFDYEEYASQQGAGAASYAGKRGKLVIIGPADISWLEMALGSVRQRVSGLLESLDPSPGRGLLRALIMGQRGELTGARRDAFGDSGTAHLLAISGMHVGLVWGLWFFLLRVGLAAWPAFALRHNAVKTAALAALVPAAAYAALAGGATPTMRALIMIACLCAAGLANRRYEPVGGLSLAAVVIIAIWPDAPLTLSFQLSFTAVGSILLIAGPVSRRVSKVQGRTRRLAAGLLGWLSVSAVVGLAVMPLTALNFHTIPWLFLPANAVLIPLVTLVVLPLALLGAAVGLVWPVAGLALWSIALVPADWSMALAAWFVALPGAVSYTAGPGWLAVALVYAAAVAGVVARRWRWSLAGGLAVLAIAAGVVHLWPTPPDGRLRAWMVDVGQGSCTVMRLPQGQVMVVDGGGWPGSDFDFGRRVVAPFLWEIGIRSVDIVVCSHKDPDHVGGLPFIVRWFGAHQVWTNDSDNWKGTHGYMLLMAKETGALVLGPCQLPRRLDIGGAQVSVLWPPQGEDSSGWKENDRSLWLGVSAGGCRIWLPGDSGPRVERRVAKSLPMGGHTLMAAPHHGGVGSCTPELMAAMRPAIVAFSCGCPNSYGMPRPKSLVQARQSGARVVSTRRRGCLDFQCQGGEWQVMPHLGEDRDCGK